MTAAAAAAVTSYPHPPPSHILDGEKVLEEKYSPQILLSVAVDLTEEEEQINMRV